MDWDAMSAVSTFAATMVALFLGVQASKGERERRELQSNILRHQITTQLLEIARFIGEKESGSMPTFGAIERQAVEGLNSLWTRSDLLMVDEQEALGKLIKAFIVMRTEVGDGVGWHVRADMQELLRHLFYEFSKTLHGPTTHLLTNEFLMEHAMDELKKGRGIKSAQTASEKMKC